MDAENVKKPVELSSYDKIALIKLLKNPETTAMVKLVNEPLYNAYQERLTESAEFSYFSELMPEWLILSDENEVDYFKKMRDLGIELYKLGFELFQEHLVPKNIISSIGYEDYCDILTGELNDFNNGVITERKFFEYFLTLKEVIYDDYKYIFEHLKLSDVEPIFVDFLREFETRYNIPTCIPTSDSKKKK